MIGLRREESKSNSAGSPTWRVRSDVSQGILNVRVGPGANYEPRGPCSTRRDCRRMSASSRSFSLSSARFSALQKEPLFQTRCTMARPKPLDRRTSRDCPESDGEQRADNIHIKWNPRVARREITRDHHLLDVSRGVAEQEDRGGADGRRLEFQIAQKATQAVAPIAKSAMPTSNWNGLDFRSDESRSDGRKENVKDTRPQSRDANWEQHYPR